MAQDQQVAFEGQSHWNQYRSPEPQLRNVLSMAIRAQELVALQRNRDPHGLLRRLFHDIPFVLTKRTPPELMFRVVPISETLSEPARTISSGSSSSNRFALLCSITTICNLDCFT